MLLLVTEVRLEIDRVISVSAFTWTMASPTHLVLLQTERCQLLLYPDYYQLDSLLTRVLPLVEKPPITVYGRVCQQNQNVGVISNVADDYHYSHQKTPEWLEQLTSQINNDCGLDMNSVLVNEY